MGVQGLWKLVAPAGRRIKLETLENKVLAIDVSIWLLKMIHGYLALGNNEHRDIHLTGIFRRIVKLLYYGIKPVFVFDGKFPELKRETVKRRQEFRERRKVNLKKVAEKFLSKVLEERLKETIGRLAQPKRPLDQSPDKNKPKKDEIQGGFLDPEEEEEKVFEEDTQVYDYEFDYIVDENKELLLEAGIDLEEFYLQDTEVQYKTIKKVKNNMRDRKIKKYLDIDSLDDLSKVHVKDYVSHIQRKNQIEKSKEEAYTKRLTKEQELVMTNSKFKDIMSSNYMKGFFLDPKKEIVHGSLASDKTKGFIYLTQKNDKYDTQVLKVEKKRGSKNEKLKRLSAHLRNIAQHAENGPQLFTFEELLADNPLEAFKYSNLQLKDGESNLKSSIAKSVNENSNKMPQEESRTNVDIDEVFGFDDWEQKDGTVEPKGEEEGKKGAVFEHDDDNSNLEDLFEYNADSQEVKGENKNEDIKKDSQGREDKGDDFVFSQDSGLEDIKSKIAKLKKEMREEKLIKEKEDQRIEDGHRKIDAVLSQIFENPDQEKKKNKKYEIDSPAREKKKVVMRKNNNVQQLYQEEADKNNYLLSMEETYYEPKELFTENTHSSPEEIVFRKKKEESPRVETKEQESPKKFDLNANDKETVKSDDIDIKEEKSTQLEDFMSPSPRKNSDEEKLENESKNKPAALAGWFQRLAKNDEEEKMEIVMSKEPEKEIKHVQEQKRPEPQMSQFSEDYIPDFGEDMDFMEMDEEQLVAQMKDLDDPDNLDKWTLMQEFQKFQNLSEFEAGSIQEKFNEIKELLILFGIPWVDSPTEAEAQCSFLEQSGLVDGVITDDSDVFLFGGNTIYRNIFEKGDFAHSYKMHYIEHDLALDREKLILLALFLGSDYTLGIRGVGIVNAIEIVTAFDTVAALHRFKEWAEVPDVLLENASEHYRNIPQKELDYKLYHRNFKKNWELPDNFPDERVIDAYKHPNVDQSLEKFQWGQPDFPGLTRYCETRLKWDEARIYNLLEPLKKAISERGNQTKITDYFREEKIALVSSKRINDAIKNLKTKETDDFHMPATITKSIDNIIESQNPRNIKKRKTGDYANEMIKHYAFDKKKVKKNT